jgi:hypothetical protein
MNENIEQKIEAAIESVEKPDFVASVSFRLAEDWSGDPAAMILVLLKDGEKSDDAYLDRVSGYKFLLLDAVGQASQGYLPYATFHLESEQAELDREEAREKARRGRRGPHKTAIAA